MRILLISLLLLLAGANVVLGSGVLEEVSVAFRIPRGLLLTMCEREGGAREDKRQVLNPTAVHDGGAGSGACGMKLETARLVVGRVVTRKELESTPFTAVVAARYLTEKRWCGRYKRWETRVLCYRVGPNHKMLPRIDRNNIRWQDMPLWWGTHKIFKRWKELHGE